MPTGMHRIYAEICRRYANGDRGAAQELFAQIQPVLAFSNQALDSSIRFFKRLLSAQGIYSTVTSWSFNVRFGSFFPMAPEPEF